MQQQFWSGGEQGTMRLEKVPGAIGILDSGVGGLTVAKEVMRQLPQEKILYFGDTERCPYGPRKREEVRQFTQEIVRYLTTFPLKALVIACNTATAAALELIQEQVDLPVLGVIAPGARAAIRGSRHRRIGVIGTEGTINSKAYEKELRQLDGRVYIASHPCPALVPLVERGIGDPVAARQVVEASLTPMQGLDLDTLILGCTHYPLLTDLIQEVMGENVSLISSAEETARQLGRVLQSAGLLAGKEASSPQPYHRFFTSGEPEYFRSLAERWLQQEIVVEQVSLDELGQNAV